ncbi:unnamed protein product [Litomosoides sigmodontis]|uniref:Uncharacterized protein n=1 Tax=Litomosoides sigmodontis TaxID=42156 RepID=A0A3P6TSR7_LITSI|nr:unnamed protein product [Litomosoides sigmodontis]
MNMSTKSEFLVDTEQQSTSDPINTEHSVSDADATNVPEVGGDANSSDLTSTFNAEKFNQSLSNAEKQNHLSIQSYPFGACSIGAAAAAVVAAAADPVLETSILLRKLPEGFGMSLSY